MSGDERDRAAAVLGNGLLPLFDSMTARDRRHCLDVYYSLLEDGCGDPDMLAAALLHDAGKGRLAEAPVRLWHRVAYVLLAAASPRWLDRLARRGGPFDRLRAGLGALHRHAERGAELATAFGARPATVELIRRHEARDQADPRLHRLQATDDAC